MKRIAFAGATFVTLAFLVILVGQVTQLAEFAERIHPLAGDATFWAVTFVLVVALTVPVVLVLRLPSPLVPPSVADGPEFEEHLARLKRRLGQNPRLRDGHINTRSEIEEALAPSTPWLVRPSKRRAAGHF